MIAPLPPISHFPGAAGTDGARWSALLLVAIVGSIVLVSPDPAEED